MPPNSPDNTANTSPKPVTSLDNTATTSDNPSVTTPVTEQPRRVPQKPAVKSSDPKPLCENREEPLPPVEPARVTQDVQKLLKEYGSKGYSIEKAGQALVEYSMTEKTWRKCVEEQGLKDIIASHVLWTIAHRCWPYYSTQARVCKAQVLAESTVEVADIEKNAMKAKNRIQSRQWLASRYDRKSYGDKVEHEISSSVQVFVPVTKFNLPSKNSTPSSDNMRVDAPHRVVDNEEPD